MKARIELIAMLVSFITTSAMAYDFTGGTGEPNDPYQIAKAEQLISIGSDPNLLDKSFVLINDIDLDPNLPGGQVFDRAVIAPVIDDFPGFQGIEFNGCLDGQNYAITNLTIDLANGYVGLIGLIGEEGIVRHVRLVNGFIKKGQAHPFVASVTGGLAGENRGTILDCHFSGNINGNYDVGGLVGHNYGDIIQSSFKGSVLGITGIGGLVGVNYDIISLCFSDSDIYCQGEVGGLVGRNWDSISNCYSMGQIVGNCPIGGLIGYNIDSGIVTTCFTSVMVMEAPELLPQSRLVGLAQRRSTIENSYFLDLNGDVDLTAVRGTPLTSAQMKQQDSFFGWDFYGDYNDGTQDHWFLLEDHYPVLTWQTEITGLLVVPNLANLDISHAIRQLESAGFVIGRIIYDFSQMIPEGRIMDLLPHPYLPMGSTVDLVVSRGPYDWQDNPGDGTKANPFQITTAAQLLSIGNEPNLLDKCFVLINDIDLAPNLPGRHVFDRAVIAPNPELIRFQGYQGTFSGSFDGDNKTIHNLVIVSTVDEFVGFFGFIGQPDAEAEAIRGTVQNLHLKKVRVVGHDYVGGIAGLNGGQIISCSVNGDVSGNYSVGELVGGNSNVTLIHQFADGFSWTGYDGGVITSSYATGNVAGEGHVGGLAGTNQYFSKISTSHSTGSVTGNYKLGGLIGSNESTCSTSQCFSTSDVSGTERVGGLVGDNYFGLIDTSYAMGNVSGSKTVGGLTGLNLGTISQCYSAGDVEGDEEIGGLVGGDFRNIYVFGPREPIPYTGETILSFWDIDSSGLDTSAGGLGKNTFRMKDIITFLNAAWDFDTIWSICEGKEYPRFQWENIECDEE